MSHRQKNAPANHSVKRHSTAGTSPLSLYTLFAAFLDAFSVEHPLQPLVGSLRAHDGFVRGEGESVRFRCRFRGRFNLTLETCHYARLKLQDRSTICRLSLFNCRSSHQSHRSFDIDQDLHGCTSSSHRSRSPREHVTSLTSRAQVVIVAMCTPSRFVRLASLLQALEGYKQNPTRSSGLSRHYPHSDLCP